MRFIPAGAGNTRTNSTCSFVSPVYPRWRGEHTLPYRTNQMMHGLSPLARGTQPLVWRDKKNLRFIPAGAGNTAAQHKECWFQPVYPRWRGEHVNWNIL